MDPTAPVMYSVLSLLGIILNLLPLLFAAFGLYCLLRIVVAVEKLAAQAQRDHNTRGPAT